MNLNGYSKEDLDYLDVKYITEITNGIEDIRVIKWRWDVKEDHVYIDNMFKYILLNNP